MAIPTQPVTSDIVDEAYKKVGIASPTTAQVDRGMNYFLQEIYNDIWSRAGKMGQKHLKSLQSMACQVTVDGQSKYDFPSDFDEEVGDLEFLDGDVTGTAAAGTTVTLTLATTDTLEESEIVGKYLLLTGGTGASVPGTGYGLRQVTSYSTATRIATASTEFATEPDNTSTYRIINKTRTLAKENIKDKGSLGNMSLAEGTPSAYSKVYENGIEKFILDVNPDASTYGILYRYYANLMKIDMAAGAAIHDLILYNWRSAITNGLQWKIAEDEDDDKWEKFKIEYEKAVSNLLQKELPAEDEFEGFEL